MSSKTITVVNKLTGEVLDFPATTDSELAQSYEQINELVGALERAKKKIRNIVLTRLDDSLDDTIDLGAYKWRKQIRHYMNYDITTLRNYVDEDLFNQLIKPDKTLIDKMIKETVAGESLFSPEAVVQLRANMFDEKPPSVAVVLERNKQ